MTKPYLQALQPLAAKYPVSARQLEILAVILLPNDLPMVRAVVDLFDSEADRQGFPTASEFVAALATEEIERTIEKTCAEYTKPRQPQGAS